MKRKKIQQYEIFKISTDRILERKNNKLKFKKIDLSKREALENGEIVKIQSNQLTNQLFKYLNKNGIKNSEFDLTDYICNVYVPTEHKRKGEKDYAIIAKKGFDLNGNHFVRLFSGSGQIRRNTITFIREDLYEPIFNALLCGLTLKDFGNDFNAAKFNAYAGLNMSGCQLLTDDIAPSVCVVDDYEAIRPHQIVNCVTEKEVSYILTEKEDLILDDTDDFEIAGDKAVRKSDGAEFIIHKGIKKYIEQCYYDELAAPPLNSFDGQGLMSPEWAEKVANYLGINYLPSEFIVRAPWVKGLLVNIPFHEWFNEKGITEITDSFGKTRKINEIDIIISKSQFKMHKIYSKKCSGLDINAWDYHQQVMKDNQLHWGITRFNKSRDDDIKSLNYQYLQALMLENSDIDLLCKRTENFLKEINSGDIKAIYNTLMINGGNDLIFDEDFNIKSSTADSYKKLYQRVIEKNPDFINDKYIRELILQESSKKFQEAKLGKILVEGNFQFCISDPIAQLEWIASNHCGQNFEIKGVIPPAHIYSNYWLQKGEKELTLMRSPLIDRNEIAKRKLISEKQHYFRYLCSGLVYSIWDLTALQQGGCDFDGDIIFSTNDKIVARGAYEFEEAKPLYYELNSTDLVGKISAINLIKADVRGLNSAVGSISNRGGSLYAKLFDYKPGTDEYNRIYDSIIALGQVVGMEIDRIKTAVAPSIPLEWNPIQITKYQDENGESIITNFSEELLGIERHNDLVPDIKPYYFRYNYDYIEDSLSQLKKSFNKASRYTFNLKFDELLAKFDCGLATSKEEELVNQYYRAYPVIDTDCIVNHICHHFEVFEKTLKKESVSEGENLLKNYVTEGFMPDEKILNSIKGLIKEYQRFVKMLTKSNNSANNTKNNKQKSEKTYETLYLISNYYRDEVLSLVSGDLQAALDYMTYATNEKTVWKILNDYLIEVVKC